LVNKLKLIRREQRSIFYPMPLLFSRKCSVLKRNIRGVGFALQCHPDGEYWECPASVAPATRR